MADYRDQIKSLLEVLEDFDPCRDLSVTNYDNSPIGSNHVGDFMEAVKALDRDFSVIYVDDYDDTIKITIQENNNDAVLDFKYAVAQTAQLHDKLYGDGKYWKQEQ